MTSASIAAKKAEEMSAISIPEAVNRAVQRIEGMSDRALLILVTGGWIARIGSPGMSHRSVDLWFRMMTFFDRLADRVDGK